VNREPLQKTYNKSREIIRIHSIDVFFLTRDHHIGKPWECVREAWRDEYYIGLTTEYANTQKESNMGRRVCAIPTQWQSAVLTEEGDVWIIENSFLANGLSILNF